MNELQAYVDSLPSMLLEEEKKKLVKQWKIDNKWGEEKPEPVGTGTVLKSEDITYGGEAVEEVIEAVKTEGDAAGAGVEPVKTEALVDPTDSASEYGSSELKESKEKNIYSRFDTDEELDKKREIATMSFGDKLLVDIKKGSTTLGEMIASVPETLYDIFALPQNILAKATGLNIEASSKKFKEDNSLGNPVLEFYEAESTKLGETQDIYNNANYDYQGIYNNFSKGNYADGFKQLASGIVESAPVSMSMMVGGAAVSTGKLAAGSTVAFAGPEIKEQREKNPGQSEAESIIKGLGLAGAESVFSSIGTGTIGKVYKDILLKEGKEEGVKIFRQGLIDMYRSALTKYGAPASMLGEGLEEVATTITQNMINGVPAFNNVADSFIQGVGGGVVYGAPVNAAQAKRAIKSGITNSKINSELGNSNYNNITDAFNVETSTSSTEINISQIAGSQQAIDAKVDKQLEAGEITVDQANSVKLRAREVQGSVNRLKPLSISIENQPALVDLMIEQKNLKNTIKQVDNSSLTKAESDRLSEIDAELGSIIIKDKSDKIDRGAKTAAADANTDYKALETQEEVDATIAELVEDGGVIDEKNSDNYGTFVVIEQGEGKPDKRIIIINKQVTREDASLGVLSRGGHEVGHAILYETFKNDPDLAVKLGKDVIGELMSNPNVKMTPRFESQLDQYINDDKISEADTMEEAIVLISNGISEGNITINETTAMKIGDFIRRTLSAMGMNVKFKDGKSVLNFVRDYTDSVHRNSGLSKGLKKAAVKGAKIDVKAIKDVETEVVEIVAKESKRETGVEASTKVQEIYDTQGEAGAFDIIEQFKPIVSRIVEKRSEAPNFDRQLLTDEIETGKRGIFDLIKEYKPESGVPLAAYINKFLPARAIEASQRVLGEEFTSDVTEARNVMAEEVETEVSAKPTTRKIRPSSLISNDAVGKIKEQVKAKIEGIDPKNLTFKKLSDLAPEIIAAEIGIPVKKLTVATANLSKGDATAIQQFVNKNADKLLKILPEGAVVEAATDKLLGTSTGVPKGLLSAFYTKQARLGKGAGLAPFKLNKGISKADFLEAFGIVEGKKAEGFDARSSQAQALKGIASLYGKLVTNEIVRSDTNLSLEVKQDVAAGKNKFMASKRITTETEMSPKLENLFKEISQAKNINQALGIMKIGGVSINDSNRVEKQKSFQDAIEKFKLDLNTFLAGSFASSGAVRSRSSNGNVYYDLSNGEKILGTRVETDSGEQKLNKDGKKMFNQPTLEAINKKFGQGVTLVASRGRLYYGATDPAYIKAKLAAEKNTKDSKFKAVKNGLPPGIDTKITKEWLNKRAAQSEINMNVLDAVVTQLSNAVADGMPMEIAATIITQGYQATSGLIKIAAPFRYVSNNFLYALNGKKSDKTGKKYREEHNPPASVVGASIILAIKNNAAKPAMDAIRKNYYQTQLSKSDDTKIDQAELASTTVDGQTIFDNPISRLAAAGIDLQTLVNPLTGKTIAEESGFGIDPKVYNKYNANEKVQASSIQNEAILEGLKNPDLDVASEIKASLPLVPGKSMASKRDSNLIPDAIKYSEPITVQKAINALSKTDKALNNARRLDAPVKKIRVFDFDDTLARTKSNVLYTMPNPSGKPSAEKKVVFLVGAAGSGKSTLTNQLGFKEQGFNVINRDTELERLTKEAGFPADMSKLTPKQKSQWREMQYKAAEKSINDIAALRNKGKGVVIDEAGSSEATIMRNLREFKKAGYDVQMVFTESSLDTALERNKNRTERSLTDTTIKNSFEAVMKNKKRFSEMFKENFVEVNTNKLGINEMPSPSITSKINQFTKGFIKGKIDAATFAKDAAKMEAEGAEFDFSEFSKVVDGKKGPLFEVAKKIADARGTEDVFILTARPQEAAGPIKAFMEANGIDIPLANITGLGDGTAEAKAGWIMGKAADGYNDFYFADDAVKNVKAVKDVLSQVDVKSKVQLAKASKRQTFDTVVNDMIEDSSGIATYKEYSAARAKTIGANKGKFNFFIPPSAEDFTGLLYKMIGKGKKGDAQMAFLKTNLLDTYDRAESAVTQAKIAAANDFKALKSELKTLPTSLSVPTGIGGFTYSHAVRVAIWSAQGMDIPGLSKRDIKELNDFIQNDTELRVFANELIKIQKGKPYPKPGQNWLGGNITSDIINDINKVNRAEYQQEFRENVDIIFSEDNMNKMEAAYGSRWREAVEDSLRRMKSGSNRPPGGNRVTDQLLDWLNNSVGAVMFLNTRSALLQTISAVNFINWGDNNIVKAGLAFANQKQFWSDFMTLMNSDYLVERREGLKINVSESEIADAVRDSKNKPKAAIAFLLSKGFVMTRFADSFAIATGGSTFYRNRVKALVGKGMEQKAAEAQAFEDFRQIAEESQQSSNPNRISQQQASGAGRVILAWANTPMQYARIQKRAGQDLINGRGDWKTNVSKIVYYGAIQNLIFNSLQQAVFALGFGEDDEDDDAKKNEKISRVANGMIDSQLKGLGIGGAAVVALKNTLMTLGEEHAKNRPEYEKAVADLLGFSPPLGSKVQKIKGGLRSFSWNMKDIKEQGFSLDNPAYLAGAQIVTGLTNIPLDRVAKKINNVRGMINEQSALWQRVALGLGWSTWDVGLGYYGGFDAAKVLTPEEEKVKEIDDMKKLTKTKEQVDMLLDLGLTKKEIKALGKEQARVEKIIELQNAESKPKEEAKIKEEIKEETKPTPKVEAKPKTESAERRLRRQFDSIKDENKPDQVKTLLKFGLSKKEIRDLQYEKNRVNKILELMEKNK